MTTPKTPADHLREVQATTSEVRALLEAEEVAEELSLNLPPLKLEPGPKAFYRRAETWVGLFTIASMMFFAILLSYSLSMLQRLQDTVDDNQRKAESNAVHIESLQRQILDARREIETVKDDAAPSPNNND